MKGKLQAIKDGDTNVYNHLIQVFKQMIVNNDMNGYQLFEYYSQNVKNNVQDQDCFRSEEMEKLVQYSQKFKVLLNKPNTGTEEEPQEPGPCGYLANLMEEAKWFQKAGVGFGQETTYIIFKAFEKFCITKQSKEIKFWGTVLGKDKDYYIIETSAEGAEQGQLPPEVEPKGTGVNKNTYWVCTDLLNGDWRQLPIVTPDQINSSRRIKYHFTGNLDKTICSNPHFKGTEAHLLKCQIVRISFSCQIVPRTSFNVNAEDKKEIEPASEEWKLPDFNFLSSLENWVHHPQNILKNGRLVLLKPNIPQGVEVDQEKLMKELEAKDPLEDRLKPISQDKCGKDDDAWALKIVGDVSEYKTMSKGKQTVNYGYVCIKSLVWKGWTLVYHNKQWSSLYIGSGNKTASEWFFPRQPEQVLCQCPDREEQPEPNIPKDDGNQKPPEE